MLCLVDVMMIMYNEINRSATAILATRTCATDSRRTLLLKVVMITIRLQTIAQIPSVKVMI